ncbi:MAG: zinc-ribbon domain-containing protein, partial [Planctomycetota bacterium]
MPEVSASNCPKCHAPLSQAAKSCTACGQDLAAWKLVRPCLERAESLLLAGKFSDAKDEFRQALIFDPACAEARQGIAKSEEQIKGLRVRHLWGKAAEAEAQDDFKGAEALYREIVG